MGKKDLDKLLLEWVKVKHPGVAETMSTSNGNEHIDEKQTVFADKDYRTICAEYKLDRKDAKNNEIIAEDCLG